MSSFKKRKRRTRPEKISTEQQLLFDELCEAIRKLGIEVRLEAGNFTGGYCLVDGQALFYVNTRHSMDYKIDLLINQLRTMDLERIYLSPQLRTILEENELSTGD
ncbi:MAG TPA: hypothetical protein ENK14_07630 [Caldithrix sp.]|nr:hypothetical protein [Caldithrix sp.]